MPGAGGRCYNLRMPDAPRGTPTPRFAPEIAFPPYSYVTGRFPHPTSDPRGHSFGHVLPPPPVPVSERWRDSRAFCFAVDLFNHGYYWESHEVWESLWHACGRHGTAADFLKALVKLAAAGVKAREGRPEGWRRHLRRSSELLAQIQQQLGPSVARYFGLVLAELVAAVDQAREAGPPAYASAADDSADDGSAADDSAADDSAADAARIVVPFRLLPQ